MTMKIYRRLLFVGVMLLMTVALTFSGPKSRAEDPCQECMDNCYAVYEGCVAAGYSGCSNWLLRCNQDCFYNSGLCTQ